MRHIPWILVGLFATTSAAGQLPDVATSAERDSDVAGEDDALTCDAGEDASACMVCFHGECCAQIARCEQDARCSALMMCRSACQPGDKTCRSACEAEHPRGVATLQAAEQCMLNSCRSACAP